MPPRSFRSSHRWVADTLLANADAITLHHLQSDCCMSSEQILSGVEKALSLADFTAEDAQRMLPKCKQISDNLCRRNSILRHKPVDDVLQQVWTMCE